MAIEDWFEKATIGWLKKILALITGFLFGLFVYFGIVKLFPRFYRFILNKAHKWLPKAGEAGGWTIVLSKPQTVILLMTFWIFIFLIIKFLFFNGIDFDLGTFFFAGIGAMAGYRMGSDVFNEWTLFKRLTTRHPVEKLPEGYIKEEERQLVAIDDPVTFTVSAPADAVSSEAAVRLIHALTALNILVAFEIVADENGFDFCLVVPKKKVNQTETAIYSVYPQAKITKKESVHVFEQRPFVRPFRLKNPMHADVFFPPILSIDQIKTADPLAHILQPLSRLNGGEKAVIQILVRRAQYPKWKKEGEKLLYKNSNSLGNFLGWGGMKKVVGQQLSGEKQTRFEIDTHTAYSGKLQQPLFEVLGTIAVKVEKEKEKEILDGLQMALAQYSTGLGELSPLEEQIILAFEAVNNRIFNITVPPQESMRLMLLTVPELAALWHLPTRGIGTPGLKRSHTISNEAPRPISQQAGVSLGTNVYQGVEKTVFIAEKDRQEHMSVLGKTGTGKSTFLHNLIHQDIQAGKGIAVIDAHGRLIEKILQNSIPKSRENDVVIFDLADHEYPVGLSFFDIPEGASTDQKEQVVIYITNLFKRIFSDQWSATRMEDTLTAAISTLAEIPHATLLDVSRLFTDGVFRNQTIQSIKDPAILEFWHGVFDKLSESEKQQMLRPILSRIRKFYRLTTIRNITCQKRSLNFKDIIDKKKIFLASMNQASKESDESHLGALLVSKLQIAGMSRSHDASENGQLYFLYIDEVQNFITTSLETVFSEARKYGLSLTVANQYLEQLKDATLNAIMGNVGAMATFQCGSFDATRLSPVVKPEFNADDLMMLSQFEAIVKMRHHKQNIPAFSIKTSLPIEGGTKERELELRALSRTKYAVKREEVEKEYGRVYQETEAIIQKQIGEPVGEPY